MAHWQSSTTVHQEEYLAELLTQAAEIVKTGGKRDHPILSRTLEAFLSYMESGPSPSSPSLRPIQDNHVGSSNGSVGSGGDGTSSLANKRTDTTVGSKPLANSVSGILGKIRGGQHSSTTVETAAAATTNHHNTPRNAEAAAATRSDQSPQPHQQQQEPRNEGMEKSKSRPALFSFPPVAGFTDDASKSPQSKPQPQQQQQQESWNTSQRAQVGGESTTGEKRPGNSSHRAEFQLATNPKSALIANGWIEQQRRSKFRTVWKEVLASLVEGRKKGEETTLWIQRRVVNPLTNQNELEALHQFPIKWLEEVTHFDYSADNRFSLKVFNLQEEFVFRCPKDSDAARKWVATLLEAQEVRKKKSKSERLKPKSNSDIDASGHSSASEGELKKGAEDHHPIDEVDKNSSVHPAAAAVPEHRTIKELRAIAHGAGIQTVGMERQELEAVVEQITSSSSSQKNVDNNTNEQVKRRQQQQEQEEMERQRREKERLEQEQHRVSEEQQRRAAAEEKHKAEVTAVAAAEQQRQKQAAEEAANLRAVEEAKVEAARRAAAAEEEQKNRQRIAEHVRVQQEAERKKREEEERQRLEKERREREEAEHRRRVAEMQERERQEQIRKQQEEYTRQQRQWQEQQAEAARLHRLKEEQDARAKEEELRRRRHAEQWAQANGQQHAPQQQQPPPAPQQQQWHPQTAQQQQQQPPNHPHAPPPPHGYAQQQHPFPQQQQQQHFHHPGQQHPQAQQYPHQQHPGGYYGVQQQPQRSPHPSQQPPPPPQQQQQQHTQSPISQKYAKMASSDSDDGGAAHRQIKHGVLMHWALQPPLFQALKPIEVLITTVHTVFPPTLGVPGHEYFQRWKAIQLAEVSTGPPHNRMDDDKLNKAVRKLRFFLHPDKLPNHLTADQSYLIKLLWDITNDAFDEYKKKEEDLGWIRS